MFLSLVRKFLLTLLTLFGLTMISYHILLRDPLNHFAEMDSVQAYFHYLSGLLVGDLGISYSNGEPLALQILNVFPATIVLCLATLLVSLLVGMPLGFAVAHFRRTMVGRFFSWLGSISLAVPVFWLAIVMLYSASINQWQISAVGELHPIYEIQPLTGFKIVDMFLTDTPYRLKMTQSALHHLAMPTLVLAIPSTLEVMRLTQLRAEYVMKQNYIKVAQTRGWSLFKIWRTHIVGNTAPALIPALARHFTMIFAFAMLIENVFSWGGIGRWLINALAVQDYNAISAGVVAIGCFVLFIDLLSSLVRTLLDPSQKKDWYAK